MCSAPAVVIRPARFFTFKAENGKVKTEKRKAQFRLLFQASPPQAADNKTYPSPLRGAPLS